MIARIKAFYSESANARTYYDAELNSLKWNGNGQGMAICPFHEDNKESLSIKDSGAYFCHACNSGGDIISFHMARHTVDFKGALTQLAERVGITGKAEPQRKLVKVYDYTDEAGEIIYQSCRYEPKDFRQRRPDGKGGWIWNLQGVQLVPYNLPEVIKSEYAFIVEGERDVESLKTLGLAASCNAQGAGKWKAEYNCHFNDKRVYILPDNDKPGMKHAVQVAKSLQGIAASIKVIDLPGLTEKQDVTDWIQVQQAEGKTAKGINAALRQVVSAAAEWTESDIATEHEDVERDNELFHIAHLMAKGGGNPAETLRTLEAVASSWGEGDKKDWLQTKVESAFARLARKEINVSDEVKRYIALSNGYFSVTDCYEVLQALQSVTSVTERYKLRTAVRVDLHREKEKGHIAPDTKRNGYFIRIDDVCEDMDIINVSTEAHPLALPVGLRDIVKIMPKNIIIIAGAKSSGKTAMLLNTAWLNRDHKEGVYYYNSEMAAEELRGRLDDFNDFDFPEHSLSEWQKVKFKERTQNFADIIKQKPNAIHIVDFLEIYEDFYAIGRYIREIHDALDKGVAIIALQKNANTDLGLGGARSIEKARLYLSLDRGVMKITDAKLFAIKGVNPRGFILNYKLLNGCHYFPDDWGWHEVNEKGEKVKF